MDFALILFVLLVLTLLGILLDRFIFKSPTVNEKGEKIKRPLLIDWSYGFFPIILFVLVLRSFVAEPFRIPSGSMLPTLENGDMILVNKFIYGLRLPIINTKIIPISEPKRGDVVVFHYPVDTSIDYIKRIVGVPGDHLVFNYAEKNLYINGQLVKKTAQGPYVNPIQQMGEPTRYTEQLGDVQHDTLEMPVHTAILRPIVDFEHEDQCHYSPVQLECTIPQGSYFVMGDNRDNSEDSRFWGFVPEDHIVGKAFFIWMNLWIENGYRDFHFSPSRIGSFH